MIGAVISCYLVIGASVAAGAYVVVAKAMDAQRADVQVAMGELEGSVRRMPGGMVGALVAITLVWPLLVVFLVASHRAGKP